jgi:hypothetical protein
MQKIIESFLIFWLITLSAMLIGAILYFVTGDADGFGLFLTLGSITGIAISLFRHGYLL